jgi:hypothetical protein
VAQHRFPDSLGPSIAAWQSAASARDVSVPKLEEIYRQQSTSQRGRFIGQLLSRFLAKRPHDVKVRVLPENKGKETEIVGHDTEIPSENLQGIGASDTVPGQLTPSKIKTLFTGCISKCL